jgi:hypothetical protein
MCTTKKNPVIETILRLAIKKACATGTHAAVTFFLLSPVADRLSPATSAVSLQRFPAAFFCLTAAAAAAPAALNFT